MCHAACTHGQVLCRSPFSMNRRFAATLGELTGGRVGLCCSSLAVLKVCSLQQQ